MQICCVRPSRDILSTLVPWQGADRLPRRHRHDVGRWVRDAPAVARSNPHRGHSKVRFRHVSARGGNCGRFFAVPGFRSKVSGVGEQATLCGLGFRHRTSSLRAPRHRHFANSHPVGAFWSPNTEVRILSSKFPCSALRRGRGHYGATQRCRSTGARPGPGALRYQMRKGNRGGSEPTEANRESADRSRRPGRLRSGCRRWCGLGSELDEDAVG
jgi:hypothetical protein